SKLQYLDLRSNNWWDIEATSLQWISRLASLHYLGLGYADLRKATYWLQVTFKTSFIVRVALVSLQFRR
ncbi:hypothetical protein Gotri_026898, partial [Gossypium trilobum]|nr:hypothetical protein [Gossypium trilobum]